VARGEEPRGQRVPEEAEAIIPMTRIVLDS